MIARRSIVILATLALLVTAVASSRPALAAGEDIHGTVTDGVTGAVIAGACVTLGPPIRCFTTTDASGFYRIDLEALAAPVGSSWDLYFLKTGYQTTYSEKFAVTGPITFNQPLMPTGGRELCPAEQTGQPTQSVYLPNITKTLGGATGWQTPFIVQNSGSLGTTLEVTYNRFLTGKCALRKTITGVAAGTSFADVPNNHNDLPGDTQFAVVVRSFGSTAVSVVNEHAGTGARAEALSYVGVNSGSSSSFLPNIVRRFFGYVTPFIIQNLGAGQTTASAKFVSFDGTAPTVTITRDIPGGSSKFIDPNSETGLVDGKQYAVTVTAPGSISVVVNTHNDAATVAAPVAYSTNGITVGANTVYGPYGAKNGGAEKRVSTIVVQNLSLTTITPSLQFDLLGGTGTAQIVSSPTPIQPGQAWAFDPREDLSPERHADARRDRRLDDAHPPAGGRRGDDGRDAALVPLQRRGARAHADRRGAVGQGPARRSADRGRARGQHPVRRRDRRDRRYGRGDRHGARERR